MFLIACVGLFFLTYDLKVFEWDSFSHWALTVKDMYYRDVISADSSAATAYKSYPPGIALWQYFFCGWSE